MRVLIADDSAFMRRAIAQMLSTDPRIQVVGAAANGRIAVEMAGQLKPDVITLDIEMPVMDGLTALQAIMQTCPTQVLMLSSLTTEGSHAALKALSLGAADVLAKDTSQVSLSITNIEAELLAKVRALALTRPVRTRTAVASAGSATAAPPPAELRPGRFDLICIGSSTGGPPVLETLLAALPPNLATPMVIAQHMPELFTRSMAERLAQMCRLRVIHAQNGMPIEAATVYIAPGGQHLHIRKLGPGRRILHIGPEPRDAIFRPSVDVLLGTAASAVGARALGIILTGIGNDGLQGARALHAAGGVILAQSADSCVVYGMPKAVTENGLAAANLAPAQIALALRSLAPRAAMGLAG